VITGSSVISRYGTGRAQSTTASLWKRGEPR
jgi:hypothetical protein